MSAIGAVASAGAAVTGGATAEFLKNFAHAGSEDAIQELLKLIGAYIGSKTPSEKAERIREFKAKHPVAWDIIKRTNRVTFMTVVKVIPGVKAKLGPAGVEELEDFARELFKGVEEGLEGHAAAGHGSVSHDGLDLWIEELADPEIHLKPCSRFERALQRTTKIPKKKTEEEEAVSRGDGGKKKPPQFDDKPPVHARITAKEAAQEVDFGRAHYCHACGARDAVYKALEHDSHDKTVKKPAEVAKTPTQLFLIAFHTYEATLSQKDQKKARRMLDALMEPGVQLKGFETFVELHIKNHTTWEAEHVRAFLKIGA